MVTSHTVGLSSAGANPPMVPGFIARRTVSEPGPRWIWSPSLMTCDGFGGPSEPPRFARNHGDVLPGRYFLCAAWRVRNDGRRCETIRRVICASCGFVLLGIGEAYRGGGSAARDSTLPSPSPTKPRGLIGERMLWAALLADAIAVLGGAPATRCERNQTCAWIADVKTEAPGSLSFVCGVLGLNAQATRAALGRPIDHGSLWRRQRRGCPESRPLSMFYVGKFRCVSEHPPPSRAIAPRRTYEN